MAIGSMDMMDSGLGALGQNLNMTRQQVGLDRCNTESRYDYFVFRLNS